MGTVKVSYREGCVSFGWTDGPLKGEGGEGFAYRARKVGEEQFFVNWHEAEAHGFVTLQIDFRGGAMSAVPFSPPMQPTNNRLSAIVLRSAASSDLTSRSWSHNVAHCI